MKPYPNYRDLERLLGVTWHDLAEREPKLGELLWEARRAGLTCRGWSDVDRALAPITDTLADLVGFVGENREHPVLGTAGAYLVAYWRLYDTVAGLSPACAAGAEEARGEQTETVAEPSSGAGSGSVSSGAVRGGRAAAPGGE